MDGIFVDVIWQKQKRKIPRKYLTEICILCHLRKTALAREKNGNFIYIVLLSLLNTMEDDWHHMKNILVKLNGQVV